MGTIGRSTHMANYVPSMGVASAVAFLDEFAAAEGVTADALRRFRRGRPSLDYRVRNLARLQGRAARALSDRGATNEAIAQALACSPRTVTNLLGRCA